MRLPALHHIANAERVLSRTLSPMERLNGVTHPDSRDAITRNRQQLRKPVPVAPPHPLDAEIARLEKQKAEARFMKLSREEQRLQTLREVREKQLATPDAPFRHLRADAIQEIVDSIKFDPRREQADLELALLCEKQHAEGMDPATADTLFDELCQQEAKFLSSIEEGFAARRAEIDTQVAELNAQRSKLPLSAAQFAEQQYGKLLYAAQQGMPMQPGDHDAMYVAEGDPTAQAAIVAKYATQTEKFVGEAT